MSRTILIALLITLSPAPAITQTRDALIGTWRLISASSSDARGARDDAPFDKNPTGFLTYTSDGRMHVIITHGGRKQLSRDDRLAVPAAEQAEAFATLIAYAGRFSVADDKVIHHVEAASIQNWVGTDLVRMPKIDGKRITLRTTNYELRTTAYGLRLCAAGPCSA